MREIKFRAWDTENKEMVDVLELDLINLWATYMIDEEGSPVSDRYGYPGNDNFRLKLMQYTDLKDKNGKEVYEGDIVRYRIANNMDESTLEVLFQDGIFQTRKSTVRAIHKICEVIGNIYENPELLEG